MAARIFAPKPFKITLKSNSYLMSISLLGPLSPSIPLFPLLLLLLLLLALLSLSIYLLLTKRKNLL